ncbi:MAG: hypothetical protein R2941_02540 [Desulfobacterales bacterium]
MAEKPLKLKKLKKIPPVPAPGARGNQKISGIQRIKAKYLLEAFLSNSLASFLTVSELPADMGGFSGFIYAKNIPESEYFLTDFRDSALRLMRQKKSFPFGMGLGREKQGLTIFIRI